MTTSVQLLQQVIDLYEEWLPESGTGEAHLRQLIDSLKDAEKPRPVKAFMPPVVERWLEHCCTQTCLPRHRPVVDTLLEFGRSMKWYVPSAEYAGTDMARNYSFSRLIGPHLFGEDSAQFYSDRIAVGFTIQAPGVYYPPHWHPAVEFYGTLTGTGLWQIGDGAFTKIPPGKLIHHPSNVSHAMQTTTEPMLTVYGWVGDIITRPTVDEHPLPQTTGTG